MKITIESIYNDNHNLFTNNVLLNSDDRLTDIADMAGDLDLIVEMSYGNREIFKRYLQEDDTECYIYDLTKIHKSIYATIVENLYKYETLLQSDEVLKDTNPLHQFYEKDIIGERVRENDMASRVDTTSHGTINKTNTYGQLQEQLVAGQAVNSLVNGARETTDAVTSFSSSSFENTDKQTTASVTDTETLGTHTDTNTTTRGNDTEQLTHGNDSITHGAHKDTITDTESIDEKMGYNDVTTALEKRRTYVKRNTINEIISDVINGITYGLYTF